MPNDFGLQALVKTSLFSSMFLSSPYRVPNQIEDGPPDARMHMFKYEGLQWLTNVIPMRKLIFVLFHSLYVWKLSSVAVLVELQGRVMRK